MAVTNYFLQKQAPLSVAADREADVLYISNGWDGAVEGCGSADGVELNFQLDTDLACGATVIGFTAYGWPERLPELARLIADHLAMPRELVDAALRNALRR